MAQLDFVINVHLFIPTSNKEKKLIHFICILLSFSINRAEGWRYTDQIDYRI